MEFDDGFVYEDMLTDLLFGSGDKSLENEYSSLNSLGSVFSDLENSVFDMNMTLKAFKKILSDINDNNKKENSINQDIRELNLNNRHDVIRVISKIVEEKDVEVANLLKGKFEYFGYEPVSVHLMKFGVGDEDAIERSFQEVCSGFMGLDLNNDEDCTKLLNFIAFLPF